MDRLTSADMPTLPAELQRVLKDAWNYISADRDSLDDACCDDGVEEANALLRRIQPFLPVPPL